MPETPLCQVLPWDSEFFGVRIGRLNRQHLTADDLAAARAWCAAEGVACLYLLADPTDGTTVSLAEAAGLHLTDIRVELDITQATGGAPVADPDIRPANAADIPRLRAMAAANHSDTRFYYDGRFPRARCDELYATWIEKSCTGFADAVLVAERDGVAAGYISCHRNADGSGQIGLVGVASDCQGAGFGKRLVAASLAWFTSQGIARVQVVTQGRNLVAQRLYQKCGFLTLRLGLWYHWWPEATVR